MIHFILQKNTKQISIFFKKYALLLFCVFNILLAKTTKAQLYYQPPTLQCVKQASGGIDVTWALPSTTNPCFDAYEIYISSNKNGPFGLETTITNPLQTNVFISVTGTIYVVMRNKGTCNNPSPPTIINSDTLDNIKPQPSPIFNTVSVINNQINVSWQKANSPEVVAYLVYNSSDNFNTADTVYGRLNTTFIDSTNSILNIIYYKIRTLEYCELNTGFQGSISIEPRNSIVLNNPVIDKCTQTAKLTWNRYENYTAGVIRYDIEVSKNGNPFTVVASANTSNASSFTVDVPNLLDNENYCVRSVAILPNGFKAYSNERCFVTEVVNPVKTDYIRNVTVNGNSITVEYKPDMLATKYYAIYVQRSIDNVAFISKTTSLPNFPNNSTIVFQDNDLDINNFEFYYRILLVDSCEITHYSDTATAIRLGARERPSNKADINWSFLKIQNAQIQQYVLEKTQNGITTTIATLNNTTNTFTDNDLYDYALDSLANACYKVTAEYYALNDSLPRTLLKSTSNEICLTPAPRAYIPNAFAPDGYNKTFKPFLIFGEREGYTLHIYDRWYEEVFSTNDVDARWDGTYKGKPAPADSYIYILQFVGKNGDTYKQNGIVMLLR